MKYVEFKLGMSRVLKEKSWQDLNPILCHKCMTATAANRLALSLANTNNTECRWNWLDSAQGHYVSPDGNYIQSVKV